MTDPLTEGYPPQTAEEWRARGADLLRRAAFLADQLQLPAAISGLPVDVVDKLDKVLPAFIGLSRASLDLADQLAARDRVQQHRGILAGRPRRQLADDQLIALGRCGHWWQTRIEPAQGLALCIDCGQPVPLVGLLQRWEQLSEAATAYTWPGEPEPLAPLVPGAVKYSGDGDPDTSVVCPNPGCRSLIEWDSRVDAPLYQCPICKGPLPVPNAPQSQDPGAPGEPATYGGGCPL